MIGWYVHHQGNGHLHRATAVARVAAERGLSITGLSSLPAPKDWPEGAAWVQLDRDDTGIPTDTGVSPGTDLPADTTVRTDPTPFDPTASGTLHWVPKHHPGLRRRSAQLSAWLDSAQPDLLVADVSVEIALLARLHGIPVVTVGLPGDRSDAAHQLGYAISDAVVGMWPPEATDMLRGASSVEALGGLSRFTPAALDAPDAPNAQEEQTPTPAPVPRPAPREVLVLSGAGGGSVGPDSVDQLRRVLPHANVTVLGGDGLWDSDPWPHLQRADLVLTAAGQNSIAEVAASRTPALVIALDRPHQEQQHMLAALERGPWPVLRAPEPQDDAGWDGAIAELSRRDGQDWASWCDGEAAVRFAELLSRLSTPQGINSSGSEARP